MKYLLLFAFLALVWWLSSKRDRANDDRVVPSRDRPIEKMVTCVHCGVHLPESEAVLADGKVYCSDTHRLAAQRVNHE